MTETSFSMIQIALAAIGAISDAFCFCWLVSCYVRKRSKAIWWLVIYLAISMIGLVVPVVSLMGFIIVIIIATALGKYMGLNTIFSSWLSVVYFGVSREIETARSSILYFLNNHDFIQIDMARHMRVVAMAYIITEVIALGVLICFIYTFHRIVRNPMVMGLQEYGLLSVLPIIAIVFAEIVGRVLFVEKDGVYFGIYDQYPLFLMLIPLISVLFAVGTLLTVRFYNGFLSLQKEKEQFFVQSLQVQAMHDRMEEVENFYGGIRKIKHEMRGHLNNISGLLESKQYKEINGYISKINDEIEKFEILIKTGDPIIDVIINDKYRQAQKYGITFDADVSFSDKMGIDPYDIGIIISNLLSNAIEQCSKPGAMGRIITIHGFKKKKFLIIEVSNPFNGVLDINADTGFPDSTKKSDRHNHGIGLINVRDAANKYFGAVDINTENSIFSVAVMLQGIE